MGVVLIIKYGVMALDPCLEADAGWGSTASGGILGPLFLGRSNALAMKWTHKGLFTAF